MNTEVLRDGDPQFSVADRWIRTRLNHTIESVHQHFAAYRLDLVAQTAYEFTWHEFCDWYLEFSKQVLQSEQSSDAEKHGTQQTLIQILETLLRLLHPLIPFITEEIWQQLRPRAMVDGETIMLRPFPHAIGEWQDDRAELEINWVMQFILGIRQIRGEMNISPGKKLPVILQNTSNSDQKLVNEHLDLLKRIGRIDNIRRLELKENEPISSTAMHGKMKLLIPLADLIDIDDEIARLTKQITHTHNEVTKSTAKLDNKNFINNAPSEIVSKEYQRIDENKLLIKDLENQIDKLQKIPNK